MEKFHNTVTFKKPSGWKRIKRKYYTEFSIVEDDYMFCEYGFAIPNDTNTYDVVSIYNYGEIGSGFFDELREQLAKLAEDSTTVSRVNEYIEEHAEGFAVTETYGIRPIFYKDLTIHGENCFVVILQITTNVGTHITLQVFTNFWNNMYCFLTSANDCDETRPFESLIENNKYIDDLVNIVLKTLDVKL